MTRLAWAARFASFLLLCVSAAWPDGAGAYSGGNGINNRTLREGPSAQGCGTSGCHGSSSSSVQVQILGTQSLPAGSSYDYTIRARKLGTGSASRMGFVVAAQDSPQPLNPLFVNDTDPNPPDTHNPTQAWDTQREVSHYGAYPLRTSATANDGGQNYDTATYVFRFTMPALAAAGSEHKLDAAAVLGFSFWNHAATFKVYVPPSAPSSASHSNVGSASATISWSGGGPRYRVLAKSGGAPSGPSDPAAVFVDVSSGTSATITGLTPNTSLYYAAVYSKVADAEVFSTNAATTGPFTTLNTQNTTTTLSSSLNPALVGNSVTFTATVAAGVGTPVGSVTFKDGATVICASVPLSGGQAQCVTSTLTTGTHSITGEYSGATGYNASTSSALSQEVRVPAPRYVNAATGVNTGDCSVQASPCKTITYAMSQAFGGAAGGDTINVAPGTYNVGLGEVFPIAFKSNVQLLSSGTPANTIIDGAGDTVKGRLISISGAAGGRIEGFTIRNGVYLAGNYAFAQGGAIVIYSATGTVTLTRNIFENNEATRGNALGFGLALGGAIYASFSPSIEITNNVFRGNVARGGNGVTGGTLSSDHNGGTGEGGAIFLDSAGGTIANNTFYGNSAIGGNGGTASNGTGNGGGSLGGAVRFNSATATVVNNIFVANAANSGTGGTPASASGAAGITGTNSLVFNNTVNGAPSGETGTVSLDPQFHAPPSILRILNSSPAKAAGTPTGAPTTDLDGTTRPNPPSIGAYEASNTVTFNMVLEGYQQVSPYVATTASGSGTAVFNVANKQLTFNLSYSGLSSAETAAHIHGPGARGANAGVLVSLSGANPKVDVVTLTASQETQLYAGQLYVNIHTSTYPNGELRAQIDGVGATTTRVLSITKSGAGTGTVTGTSEAGTVVNCGSDCSETIPLGKVATLTATPAGGSVFIGWSGACTGTGQCQVTMDSAKNVDANFFAVVPRYVNAATGANSGNCSSSSSPCKTITYAMSQASSGPPGDPVNVAPGTYNVALGEVFPIVFKSGVQLQSTGTPANTIIDGTGDTVRKGLITAVVGGGGRLEGFTLANGVHEADQLAQGGAVRIFGVSSSSFTVTRNVFTNNEARGGLALGGALYVSSTSGTGSISVTNNVFVGNIARGSGSSFNGDGEGGGVYFEVPVTGSATNNTFHGNSAIGRNNSGVPGGNARGGGAAGNSTLTIVNNIFSANSATAGTGSPAGTATAGAAATASGSSSNNLTFGNLVNGAASIGDSLGSASVAGDPKFHAPPSNLRILPSSAAAGAGTATGAPSNDFEGVARANPPSIGAFEPSSLAPTVSLGATSVDFGGQSMGTTSPAIAVTLTNTGNSALAVSSVAVSNGQFAQTHNCGSVAAGASCTINATFTPAATGGAINSTVAVSGTLTITSNASGSPHTVSLAGIAEKSLVTHYYRSILRRAPDTGGKAYWQNEAARVAGLGASVNEVWFALSGTFYTSPEYLAQNRDNTGFATDMYNTFFNRAPDAGGLGYWVGQLDSGMPREVLLAQFMFSPEFGAFTTGIFGTPTTRAEVNMVMDFYRGILGRLPDDGGLNYWVQRFRTAQCQGQAAITAEVEAISSAFTLSGEYAARSRDNTRYVGDLYNAFLRRGGDLTGVQYWINQVASGARTREQVRVEFKNSPEFQARVNSVIAQGCLQ